MALSDYAFAAFGNDGKPADGVKMGRIFIEPYKTWLYLRSGKLFQEGERFCNDVIAQIDGGSLSLFGCHIDVKSVELESRDKIPYHTVNLFFCRTGYGEALSVFGGVMCYAHLNIERAFARELGIADSVMVNGGSQGNGEGGWNKMLWVMDTPLREVVMPPKWSEMETYCGVTNDMIDALLAWDIPDSDWKKRVQAQKDITWMNLADRYFLGASAKQNVGDQPKILGEIVNEMKGQTK